MFTRTDHILGNEAMLHTHAKEQESHTLCSRTRMELARNQRWEDDWKTSATWETRPHSAKSPAAQRKLEGHCRELWDAAEVVLRGGFIASNAYSGEERHSPVHNLSFALRHQEKSKLSPK